MTTHQRPLTFLSVGRVPVRSLISSTPSVPLVAVLLLLAPVMMAAETAATPPNVIVILADDLGYGSVGCYGAKPEHVRTPHIDRLANEGRRFTDAHTPGSVCSPTRYALITGRYCWRLARTGVFGTHDPLKIETSRTTIASLFAKAGYRTAVVGKWHLGLGAAKSTDYTQPLVPGPREIGFGYDLLVPQNHGDTTNVFIENGKVAGLRSATLTPGPINTYGKPTLGLDAPQRVDEETNGVLADKAVAWLADNSSTRKPFFLYFAPVAVHNPITPSVANRGKSGCGSYGDFLMDLDDSVGRLLAEVERQGLSNNTIVVFTSDNGGELAPGKIDSPQVAATQAGLQINGPWRGGKHGVFEGGFRVPYLVRWPARIAPGTTSAQTINLVDTMATLAALIGAPLPAAEHGAEDSVDVSSAWLGTSTTAPRRAMITVSEDGVFAIRRGPWKWIEGIPAAKISAKHPRAEEHRPRLIDLERDPGETGDQSANHPQVVEELKALLEQCRSASSSRQLLSNSTTP